MTLMFDEVECGQCGKKFAPRTLEDYTYKMMVDKNRMFFCSWKCMRAYEKKHKQPSKRDAGITGYLL